MKKKGIQLNNAFQAVLVLVLVAILVIVAIYMFSSLETTMLVANTAGTVVNESVSRASITPTGYTLSVSGLTAISCGAITAVYNASGTAHVSLANFTQSNCVIRNASNLDSPTYNFSTNLKFNYPYTYSSSTISSNASNTMLIQFATYPVLIGLVGTIIFLALVIGVLVASFAFGKKGV